MHQSALGFGGEGSKDVEVRAVGGVGFPVPGVGFGLCLPRVPVINL